MRSSSELKKQRIIAQAKIEFANYLYEHASINRLIKAIDMPRGTYYLSFKNKEDLYYELIREYKIKVDEFFIKIAKKHNGDIKKTYLEIYEVGAKSQNKLFKNILINFSTKHYLNVIPSKPEDIIGENYLDFSDYTFKDEEDRLIFIRLLDLVCIQNICQSDYYYKDAKHRFETQLDIVLNGKKNQQES